MQRVKIKDIMNLVKKKLEDGVKAFPQEHRRSVEIPVYLADYKLNNLFGVFLVIPLGGGFGDSKASNVILQNHDIQIGVLVGMRCIHSHPRPEEYVELAIRSLTGVEIEEIDRTDRKIYPIKWEPVEELWKADEWWYKITFVVPNVNLEE